MKFKRLRLSGFHPFFGRVATASRPGPAALSNSQTVQASDVAGGVRSRRRALSMRMASGSYTPAASA